MKARAPKLDWAFKAPVAANPASNTATGACIQRNKISLSPRLISPQHISSWFDQNRLISTSTARPRFSLAERIKQFLPADAAEDGSSQELDWIADGPPSASLAAYESEVSNAVILVEQFKYKSAGTYLLENMPLQSMLTALVTRVIPAIQAGPTGLLGVVELGYGLYQEGHEGLANQMLQEFDLHPETLFFVTADALTKLSRKSHALTAVELDQYLGISTSAQSSLHFPQILSNEKVSAWFKAHLMAQLNPDALGRWLSKYSNHFTPESIALLALLTATDGQFKSLADWVVNNKSDSHLVSTVMKVVSTPNQFHTIGRRLLKKPVESSETASAMLATAIRLKQTYDMANICKHCASSLKHPDHDVLLAKALLAAAFAQHKPDSYEDEHNSSMRIVADSNEDLHTFLARRVLTPVLHDDGARNAIIRKAATRLYHLHSKNIPGKVLWQLIMSLPGPLSGYANVSLAKLILNRPYIEQIRYMSLPIVTAESISQLLRWHITKIMEHRRVNAINPLIPQAKEDIQLLVVGMLLASEKKLTGNIHRTHNLDNLSRQSPTSSIVEDQLQLHVAEQDKELGNNMEQQKPLALMIAHIFETNGSGFQTEAADLAVNQVALQHSDRELSASIAFYVIAELVRQKCYTVAKQLLNIIGPHRVSAAVFNNLLLNLAADHPEDSYNFVLWLVKTNNVNVQPHCINQMLRILTRSHLSESQLINRFQSLRMLLRTSLKSSVEAEPAIDLVNALIKSAYSRGRGSQLRLKWALEVAKGAKVPESEFDRWNVTLNTMQDNRQGYWSDTSTSTY